MNNLILKTNFIIVLFVFLSLFFSRSSAANSKSDCTIFVISDLNGSYGSVEYGPGVKDSVNHLIESEPDLVICAGDMVAGQKKSLTELELKAMWKSFDNDILKSFQNSDIPFAFTLGNHDGSSSGSFQNERLIAAEFWKENIPNLHFSDKTFFPFYYSFKIQDIFCAVLDASSSRKDQSQLEWLLKELESPSAVDSSVRIVIGHLPLFPVSKGRDRPGEYMNDGKGIHEALIDSGVDYYISGHQHAFYPGVLKGKEFCRPLRLLSAGAAGSGPRKYLNSDGPAFRSIIKLEKNRGESIFDMTALNIDLGFSEIDIKKIPERLISPSGTLIRYR